MDMVLFSSLTLVWDWSLPVEEMIKNVRIKTIIKIQRSKLTVVHLSKRSKNRQKRVSFFLPLVLLSSKLTSSLNNILFSSHKKEQKMTE